jgi:hypothetical protein
LEGELGSEEGRVAGGDVRVPAGVGVQGVGVEVLGVRFLEVEFLRVRF